MYHKLSRSTGQKSRSRTLVHNVSASKNAIIQARISCRRSNLVKIFSEPSATLKYGHQGPNVKHWNSHQLRRWLFDCVQICYKVSSRHRLYAANVQCQRSKVKVTGSKVKFTA